MKVASLKLSVLSIAMLSTFSSHADNYLGTSVAEGDTALSGVTSGDKTVNDNQGNTQIYYGDGKAAIFVSQDANTYNYSNGGYPNADSTNVDMYISADKTQINSTSTIIKSGTQEVYNATAGDTTLTADDNITAKVKLRSRISWRFHRCRWKRGGSHRVHAVLDGCTDNDDSCFYRRRIDDHRSEYHRQFKWCKRDRRHRQQ